MSVAALRIRASSWPEADAEAAHHLAREVMGGFARLGEANSADHYPELHRPLVDATVVELSVVRAKPRVVYAAQRRASRCGLPASRQVRR